MRRPSGHTRTNGVECSRCARLNSTPWTPVRLRLARFDSLRSWRGSRASRGRRDRFVGRGRGEVDVYARAVRPPACSLRSQDGGIVGASLGVGVFWFSDAWQCSNAQKHVPHSGTGVVLRYSRSEISLYEAAVPRTKATLP